MLLLLPKWTARQVSCSFVAKISSNARFDVASDLRNWVRLPPSTSKGQLNHSTFDLLWQEVTDNAFKIMQGSLHFHFKLLCWWIYRITFAYIALFQRRRVCLLKLIICKFAIFSSICTLYFFTMVKIHAWLLWSWELLW